MRVLRDAVGAVDWDDVLRAGGKHDHQIHLCAQHDVAARWRDRRFPADPAVWRAAREYLAPAPIHISGEVRAIVPTVWGLRPGNRK